MTLKVSFVIFGLAMSPYLCHGQTQHKLGGGPFSPPAGNFVFTPDSGEGVGTLDTLLRMSGAAGIIVDGVVTTVLPPIDIDPNLPSAVVTPAYITISSVIYGNAPAGNQILLIERGGQHGKWNVTVAGDPLVTQGQRYILFLAPVRYPIPNSAGILPEPGAVPLYSTVNYANGKATVDSSGNIQFAPGAVPALLHHNGESVSTFLSTVTARLRFLFPPLAPYPVGVTPLTPPSKTIFPTAPMPN